MRLTTTSIEMINYQREDSFIGKAESLIINIYADITNKTYKDSRDLLAKSPYVASLSKLIFTRFGLKNEIPPELVCLSPMAVIPFLNIDKTFESLSGFSFSFIKDFLQSSKKLWDINKNNKIDAIKANNKTGFVNTKLAKVGGYMSEFTHYFIFDFYSMYEYKLTPKETVAVLLHEIGHAFTGLEYHYMLEQSNASLRQVMIEINNNNPDQALYIFNSKISPNTKIIDVDEFKNMTRQDMTFKVFSTYFDTIKSQMISNTYNKTTFENLSDSFATRFGLGSELALSLDKMYEHHGMNGQSFQNYLIFMGILYLILVVSLISTLIASGAFSLAALVFCSYFIGSGFSRKDMTYDDMKDRYERIRNSMVNELKKYILVDKKLTKKLIEDIEQIDILISLAIRHITVNSTISDIIFPSDKRAKYYYNIQRDLEDLANNSLFFQAGKLSQL